MPSYARDILILFVLILANGVFAMSEAAVMAARHARLQERANRGDARAKAALDLAAHPNRFLSTTQIGITLISILSGAFGGATLSHQLADVINRIPALGPYSHTLALVIVVGSITFVSLVVGELVPKRLALNNPEGLASTIAGPMRRLSAIVAPAVTVLSATTEAILRLTGSRRAKGPPVTEDEVKILLEQGAESGVFLAAENEMIESVFRLTDRRVNDLMTPRPNVVWLDVNDPLEANIRKMRESGFSRFPVGQDSLDNFLGMVSVKRLWLRAATGEPIDLRDLLWQPRLIPENAPALQALDAFRQTGHHVAIAIDEYGGIQGLVTLIDVLESIVGDLPPAPGVPVEEPVRREDGSWLLDGLLPMDEVRNLLDIRERPDADEDYNTLGGFVMARLQRVPSPGESFIWDNFHFEVVDMDRRRVDKVLVTSQRKP